MIRVLIADDHELVRSALAAMISAKPDLEVVAEVGDGREAVRRVLEGGVDVVLLDLSMPGPGFVPVIERIAAASKAPPVLVLTGYPEEQFAIRALRAGAAGYFTKGSRLSDLIEAIRTVAAGHRFISPSLGEYLAAQLSKGERNESQDQLSNREYQVLALFGRGFGATRIAEELGLSVKTVSTYRARLLVKLGAETTAELVRYAILHAIS